MFSGTEEPEIALTDAEFKQSEAVPTKVDSQEPQILLIESELTKKIHRIIFFALFLSTIFLALSPVLCRVVPIAIDVLPHLTAINDPVRRGELTTAVQQSISQHYPEGDLFILELLNRLDDEGFGSLSPEDLLAILYRSYSLGEQAAELETAIQKRWQNEGRYQAFSQNMNQEVLTELNQFADEFSELNRLLSMDPIDALEALPNPTDPDSFLLAFPHYNRLFVNDEFFRLVTAKFIQTIDESEGEARLTPSQILDLANTLDLRFRNQYLLAFNTYDIFTSTFTPLIQRILGDYKNIVQEENDWSVPSLQIVFDVLTKDGTYSRHDAFMLVNLGGRRFESISQALFSTLVNNISEQGTQIEADTLYSLLEVFNSAKISVERTNVAILVESKTQPQLGKWYFALLTESPEVQLGMIQGILADNPQMVSENIRDAASEMDDERQLQESQRSLEERLQSSLSESLLVSNLELLDSDQEIIDSVNKSIFSSFSSQTRERVIAEMIAYTRYQLLADGQRVIFFDSLSEDRNACPVPNLLNS